MKSVLQRSIESPQAAAVALDYDLVPCAAPDPAKVYNLRENAFLVTESHMGSEYEFKYARYADNSARQTYYRTSDGTQHVPSGELEALDILFKIEEERGTYKWCRATK